MSSGSAKARLVRLARHATALGYLVGCAALAWAWFGVVVLVAWSALPVGVR